jgi:hypothetical protein
VNNLGARFVIFDKGRAVQTMHNRCAVRAGSRPGCQPNPHRIAAGMPTEHFQDNISIITTYFI